MFAPRARPRPENRIGYVHLRVANLDRSTAFYRDVLGFCVTMDGRPFGLPAVFLAANDGEQHVALNAFGGTATAPVPRGHTALHHFAVHYHDPLVLVETVLRLFDREHPISHAADHGGTVSIYLDDPDGNGVELYHDRPEPEEEPQVNEPQVVRSEPFDPVELMEVLAR